jgi:hypothetical protein
MNWLHIHADDLIERVEPAEALAQLRQQSRLSPEETSKLDIYLHHWALLVLQRSDDPVGVQEVLTLTEIAQDLAPKGVEGQTVQQRWGGFADLLEGKRKQLQARQDKPPVQLKQQDAILQRIGQSLEGRIKQSDLKDHLQLSKGRVSQILGLLESRSLITRQREGKESWVRLTQANITPATPVQNNAGSFQIAPHIGRAVFAGLKAA